MHENEPIEPVVNQVRLQNAYNQLKKTNKICWQLVEIYEALEYVKDNKFPVPLEKTKTTVTILQNKSASKRLSQLQSSLDRLPCHTQLKLLQQQINELSPYEKTIIKATNEFENDCIFAKNYNPLKRWHFSKLGHSPIIGKPLWQSAYFQIVSPQRISINSNIERWSVEWAKKLDDKSLINNNG
jgi:hypothetical protein